MAAAPFVPALHSLAGLLTAWVSDGSLATSRLSRLCCVIVVGWITAGSSMGRAGEPPRPIAVCSTTQVADFARQVVGDDWEVRCVLAPGQDPHLYEIKPHDVLRVRDASLCLANGLHLEQNDWMSVLARDAGKPLVVCAEGIEPLMLPDESTGEAGTAPDPHAWFAPTNAAVYVRNILAAVSEIDAARRDRYRARAELYLGELRTLDAWIRRECNAIPPDRRVLVTSHDAFQYFCRQYGFRSAAPVGWSTGEEVGGGVTFERRTAAIESVRRLGVKAVFVETSVNEELIREMAREAGVRVGGKLYSDSMGPAGSAGESYLGMMRENVLTIAAGLK